MVWAFREYHFAVRLEVEERAAGLFFRQTRLSLAIHHWDAVAKRSALSNSKAARAGVDTTQYTCPRPISYITHHSQHVSLGIVNYMVALLARAIAPEALGALTGLTRCLFTLGYCVLPASLVPMLNAAGLIAPCALMASLFVSPCTGTVRAWARAWARARAQA